MAIALFVKNNSLERGVWHADLWGKRLSKYKISMVEASKKSINWSSLNPSAPEWLFKPQDAELGTTYRNYWALPAIFGSSGTILLQASLQLKDEFAISFDKEEAIRKIGDLLKSSR